MKLMDCFYRFYRDRNDGK